MDIFNSFVKIHLCGSAHQRDIGLRGLRLICEGGHIEVSSGFWQLQPTEANTCITSWAVDISRNAARIVKFLEVYQVYASQESIFIQVKDEDRHFAMIVYAGEWQECLENIDHGLYLANWFERNAALQAQCDTFDGRDEYNPG